MSSGTTKTAPVDATATHSRPAEMTRAPPLEDNAKLVQRVRELQNALETAGRDSGDLRRELGRARAEIRYLRSEQRAAETASALAQFERTARIRLMLRDTHSRNP
jgi:uncharacterized membrane protein YccC